MAGVVKAMDAAMKSMNLEKISGLMDKFEQQFEDLGNNFFFKLSITMTNDFVLDVQSNVLENTMSSTVTTSVPQTDVDSLMQRVADEAGLELNMELPANPSSTIASTVQASTEQDELSARLAKLRQTE